MRCWEVIEVYGLRHLAEGLGFKRLEPRVPAFGFATLRCLEKVVGIHGGRR